MSVVVGIHEGLEILPELIVSPIVAFVGSLFYAFEVEGRFSTYGLVVVPNGRIDQMVISRRVVGLEIERAVLSYVMSAMRAAGHHEIDAETYGNG